MKPPGWTAPPIFQNFWHIALPLSKPMLITVAIMNMLATWNDYIWPLVTIPSQELWTISLGIVQLRQPVWGPGALGAHVRRLMSSLPFP